LQHWSSLFTFASSRHGDGGLAAGWCMASSCVCSFRQCTCNHRRACISSPCPAPPNAACRHITCGADAAAVTDSAWVVRVRLALPPHQLPARGAELQLRLGALRAQPLVVGHEGCVLPLQPRRAGGPRPPLAGIHRRARRARRQHTHTHTHTAAHRASRFPPLVGTSWSTHLASAA
jgi:hypothetical protein